MRILFCIFKYFPYGGVQRTFYEIAKRCLERGHQIQILTLDWQGERPDDFPIEVVKRWRLTNHQTYQAFINYVHQYQQENKFDRMVAFNKTPGADFYYIGDQCVALKKRKLTGISKLFGQRYEVLGKHEAALFNPESHTQFFIISDKQKSEYQSCYHTQAERFHVLPPGITKDRIPPANSAEIRQSFRKNLGIADDEFLILQIGSGFKIKGLDRTLHAVKALPEVLKNKTKLIAIGHDKIKPFEKLAAQLGLSHQVEMIHGSHEVPNFLLAGDLLSHPALYETGGAILIEAMLAGLPVITTNTCGYSHYVNRANAGVVMPYPFNQEKFNDLFAKMLTSPNRAFWQANGKQLAKSNDLFNRTEVAVELIES